jgi:hypothetical protein
VPPKIEGSGTPDDESLAFEREVLRRVTGQVGRSLSDLVTAILAAFEAVRITRGGTLSDAEAREFGALIASRLVSVPLPRMLPTLQRAAADARDLGQLRAVQRFSGAADRNRASAANWRKDGARPDVPNPDKAVKQALRDAAKIARAGIRTQADASAVAGKVKAAKATIEGHARSVANEGINAGTAAVATHMELRLLWVAERNACLDCLAHAGHAVTPGDLFPGVSFDPRSRPREVEFPPLHPNCRCQVRTFDGPAGPPPPDRSSISPAARLAAEARRSVVYQWTDYESGPAQRRAAEALLRAGAGLPASVEQRARRMLRAKGGGKR